MSLMLAYYGDDFTGSTDVLEALSGAGVRTVLFCAPPSPEKLAQFPGIQAFGIAGGSRTHSPEQMEKELPAAFATLRQSAAPIVHYKICSTFDSSPHLGSIGRAIEIGRRVFGDQPTPLVVGAPVLGRYVVFGNLFARSGLDSEPSRLDRHPTMSRHPVTPMDESELRLHLGRQTSLPTVLVNVLELDRAAALGRALTLPDPHGEPAGRPPPVILFDVLRDEHLPLIGQALENFERGQQRLVVGSSGVEYALIAHWRRTGLLPETAIEPRPSAAPVDRIVGVSGSCSPVTERQIALATKWGLQVMTVDPSRLLQPEDPAALLSEPEIQQALRSGRSVIFNITGQPDSRPSAGLDATQRLQISQALGRLLELLLQRTGARRAVVCGGDTSTGVAAALGIDALEFLCPMAPGSPLSRVRAPGRVADGCEMVFKGGQVGKDRFFLDVLAGKPEVVP